MAENVCFLDCMKYAKDCLGIEFELKDKQIETLRSVYEGNDTLAVLPTGFGKSIIFQLLPFMFQRKFGRRQPMITIIVTPLNSIMQDQVQSLTKRGIPACFLNIEGTGVKTFVDGKRYQKSFQDEDSDTDIEEVVISSAPLQDVKKGNFCLIYAHPETLVDKKDFGKVLRSTVFQERVCAIVVDEVHMISEWGKEFRNSFDKLGNLTCLFPDVPHLALTATATKSDIARLSEVLQYRDTQFVIANPDRPNIYLEIRSRLPNIRKFEKFDNILAEIVSELSDKLDRYPVTIAYCNNLEAIGYAYVYTEQKLGPRAYIPQEGVPENRIFGSFTSVPQPP
ncbi:bifunctional 3'-5' exonuclease/ATP-dependent helicase WRN-like [Saccostrea cucullata]|uniref:bifunctional 3'-5' exonuclease/ATP-dependent helicase WRN-like n=1 Tax=Saccostrea cuccullata TaxID=36930 RepID=UPI002ED57D11